MALKPTQKPEILSRLVLRQRLRQRTVSGDSECIKGDARRRCANACNDGNYPALLKCKGGSIDLLAENYGVNARIEHTRRHPSVGRDIRVVRGVEAISAAEDRRPVLDGQQHGSSLEAPLLEMDIQWDMENEENVTACNCFSHSPHIEAFRILKYTYLLRPHSLSENPVAKPRTYLSRRKRGSEYLKAVVGLQSMPHKLRVIG